MKKIFFVYITCLTFLGNKIFAQDTAYVRSDTNGNGWVNMFNADISDAIFPKGVWTISGVVITASKDEAIWSKKEYDECA